MTRAFDEYPLDKAAVLTFARALDAAIIKTSGLFLGYVLVFTGALYVLRIATSQYRFNVKSGRHSGTLQTSSPGLVMITLGVFLVALTVSNKTVMNYGEGTSTSAPPVSSGEGTSTSAPPISSKSATGIGKGHVPDNHGKLIDHKPAGPSTL